MGKENIKKPTKVVDDKEIIALDDFEHVLLRPTMWVGSIEPCDETVHIIENNTITNKTKKISIGFYKILNEIVDNAFDEAKRMNGKMPKITININSSTKEVVVTDAGGGFSNPDKINAKTGQSNVETAMSRLRAGSNFYNDDADTALIGTNGVGAALVNMLSDEFEISTTNDKVTYNIKWLKFKKIDEKVKAKGKSETGTTVRYIPRADKFGECVWDKEYVHSMFIFRQFLKKLDAITASLVLEVYYDGELLDLDVPFLPKNAELYTTKLGTVAVWESFDHSASISFVNGANCVGIHQKIVSDWLNDIFKFNGAQRFYETMVILNMPPKYVRFRDQNKTRYDMNRADIQDMLEESFHKILKQKILKSELYTNILAKIEDFNQTLELKNIKSKKKAAKKKISDKYFPPTQSKGTLFIVEGFSALASCLQKRDPRLDGIYALKGKIKNAKVLRDLATNEEVIDLMNILNLEPNDGSNCVFSNIVIATDPDPDGLGHIASLLINLFYKWFPHVIDSGKLNILIIPLISAEVKNKRQYFYSALEWSEFTDKSIAYKNVRYLKGLGSLSIQDWEVVMAERKMYRIKNDKASGKYMDIAFGNSADKRKKWLEGKT